MCLIWQHYFPLTKPNKRLSGASARWVFLTFEGINTFEFQEHRMVTGMQPYQNALLKILGQLYESFYSRMTKSEGGWIVAI